MRRARTKTGLAFLLLLSASIALSETEESGPCSRALPQQLAEQIGAKFPGWRTKHISDLGSDDHALWLHAHSKECPGAATGHFKKPDVVSYAVLLVPIPHPDGGYKLMVANNKGENHFDFDLLDHSDTGSASGMVVSRARPGKYSDSEQTESITIKLDSINVEWIEKGAVLYYGNGHQYQSLQTSD